MPGLFFGPLLKHSRSLADHQSRSRPLPHESCEYRTRLFKIIAGEKQPLDALIVPAPYLHLEEVALVGKDRIVGFFV